MKTEEVLKALEADIEDIKKQIALLNEKYTEILWVADYPTCLSEMKDQQLLDADKIIENVCALKIMAKITEK